MKPNCTYIFKIAILLMLVTACSTTSNLPEGEQLYRGIGKLTIEDATKDPHALEALEEVNAALAAAPNGALMGSSSIVTPFPIGLWVYNGLLEHQGSSVGRWMFNTFGTQPVLISSVNPTLRARMAGNSLQNFGYFRSEVVPEVVTLKNPKKAKVNYKVRMGKPYLIDTIYLRKFPEHLQYLLDSTRQESVLKTNEPFSVIRLDAERNRVSSLFRDNGYFYYKPEYLTYKADTVAEPWKVQLMMEPVAANSLSAQAMKPWKIGKLTVKLRKNSYQRLRDTLQQRNLQVQFRGKRVPVRPRVLVHALDFRMGQYYSQARQKQTELDLLNLGIFSQTRFTYTPRDTLGISDTLDVEIDATLDKPLTAELKTDLHTKSNGLTGPNVGFSLDKKNLFRGGEVLSLNANASYEWQITRTSGEGTKHINSWDLELAASLTVPRILFPGLVNLRSKRQRSTLFKLSVQDLRRSSYYDLITYGAEFTYNWQTDAYGRFSFTPLRLTYTKLGSMSEEFFNMAQSSQALLLSLSDQFIPVMSVSYTYDNRPQNKRVSTWWQVSVAESGNLLSLFDKLRGHPFSEKQKTMWGSPYSQFIKVIGELRKTYRLTEKTQLATRVMGGVIIPYGNIDFTPYYESFYVGGANSIRAFSVRGIGPGGYYDASAPFVTRVGDMKFEANAEYRFNLIGHFNGAVFLDAGNIWKIRQTEQSPNSEFALKHFGYDLALGTGVGLRYDMDFLVIRVDLGIPLHYPYRTEKSGYFNNSGLFKNMAWHFAIGYPF